MSRLDLVVGPNGAGKSTFVRLAVAPQWRGAVFVNADLIAAVDSAALMRHVTEFAKRIKLSGTPEELESFRYLQASAVQPAA